MRNCLVAIQISPKIQDGLQNPILYSLLVFPANFFSGSVILNLLFEINLVSVQLIWFQTQDGRTKSKMAEKLSV